MQSNPASQLFADDLWNEIDGILRRLDSNQALWLSGYLAGKPANAVPSGAPESKNSKILIAYGSETGNSEKLARQMGSRAAKQGISAQIASLADIRLRQLAKYQYLLVICSTHGDGDPPEPITAFYNTLMQDPGPDLHQLNYAVLALGDSSYEHFCKTGRQIDERLAQLKATRIVARAECDVDFAEPARQWMDVVLNCLPSEGSAAVAVEARSEPARQAYSKQQPLMAEVIENLRLSSDKRGDPIHHLAIALDDENFTVAPGDAVGVLAENPPALVAAVLDATRLSGEQPVTLDGQAMPLVQALREARDLTIPGQRFLETWAEVAKADVLKELLAAESKQQRKFLRTHQVLDLISQHRGTPDAQMLVDSLRPLQPRLYDVASSPNLMSDELHLTVQQYRYPFRNRIERGIASDFLLNISPGESLRIYPHANHRFRLPEAQGAPLILIAEGTGIAPFRSFIQEIKAAGHTHPAWLLFAEQCFEEDFLYQLDFQQAHAEGLLQHVDTVFYREEPNSTLATRLMEQVERLVSWLEEGGHLYLCGNRERLTECENAIRFWLESVLHKNALWESLNTEKRIHRNLY